MQEASRVEITPALIVEDVPATAAYLAGLLVELCGSGSDIETAGALAAARGRSCWSTSACPMATASN